MKTLKYICKFCGIHGTASYCEECPPLDLESWKSILSCNRCADYESTRRRIEDRILRSCGDLVMLDFARGQSLKEPSEKESNAREEIRKALIFLTKRFASAVCTYYHKPMMWEPDFVAILCDTPNKANVVLHQYLKDMSKQNDRAF